MTSTINAIPVTPRRPQRIGRQNATLLAALYEFRGHTKAEPGRIRVYVGVDPLMQCNFTTIELISINGFARFRGLNPTCTVLARSVHDLWRDQISLSIVQVRPTLSIQRNPLNMREAMIMWECESA